MSDLSAIRQAAATLATKCVDSTYSPFACLTHRAAWPEGPGGCATARAARRVVMDGAPLLLARCDALAEALRVLRQWDVLTLDADGNGAVTADAPWAVELIDDALASPSTLHAKASA